MDAVYLATDGTYSDYHIVAAFAHKEHAETFAAEAKCMVEEYPLHHQPPEKRVLYTRALVPRPGEHKDEIVMAEESREEVRYIGLSDYSLGTHGEPKPILHARTFDNHVERLMAGKMLTATALVQVWGFDKGRVEKAFRDRVAEVRARIEGVA